MLVGLGDTYTHGGELAPTEGELVPTEGELAPTEGRTSANCEILHFTI